MRPRGGGGQGGVDGRGGAAASRTGGSLIAGDGENGYQFVGLCIVVINCCDNAVPRRTPGRTPQHPAAPGRAMAGPTRAPLGAVLMHARYARLGQGLGPRDKKN